MNQIPKISIIIVTHNSQDVIHKNINSIENQILAPSKIVIFDSGSEDINYLKIYEKKSSYEVIYSENVGFCKGNNIGANLVFHESDFILFLNPDVFLRPDFLEKALSFMMDEPNVKVGCLTGPLLKYDIQSDKPLNLIDSLGIYQKWYGRWYDKSQGSSLEDVSSIELSEIPAICGALMFCRKVALIDIIIDENIIFDERFFMYKEDIDLSIRLRNKGWHLIINPEVSAFHCRGWNSKRANVPNVVKILASKNDILLYKKHKLGFCMWPYAKYLLVKLFSV